MGKISQFQIDKAKKAMCQPKATAILNKNNPMVKKAYNAFHAAKGRCKNPANKDYPSYGGKGVQFLMETFQELIDAIGLPQKGLSLDRINPAGNYEVGNIRWVNKHVQAANKSNSLGGSIPSVAALVQSYVAKPVIGMARAQLSDVWVRAIAAFNRGRLTPSDIEAFRAAALPPETFQHGWELGQIRDLAEPPSYFRLPSLTRPGSAIELRGGPFATTSSSSDLDGALRGLQDVPASANLHPIVIDWAQNDVNGSSPGAFWVCRPTGSWLAIGGTEGQMLVVAAVLRRSNKRAAIFTFEQVLEKLREIGPTYLWSTEKSVVLDAPFLLIPDFQVDAGPAFSPPQGDWSLMERLLRYRINRAAKTFLGIESPHSLPDWLRRTIFPTLTFREMPLSEAMAIGKPARFKASGPMPPEGTRIQFRHVLE